MKRLEISKIMDEYIDTEFFPADGSTVDPEAVKARVLAGIKAPAGKKRLFSKKKLLLTVGLAAALVLVGAGLPSAIYRYQLVNSTLTFEQDADSRSAGFEHGDSSIQVEDGRLFFVLDGGRTDITDLISEDTPYIYDGSDPETGLTYYLIMGGTLENYGWLEWVEIPIAEDGDPTSVSDGDGRMASYNLCTLLYNEESGKYIYPAGCTGMGSLHWDRMKDFPWLIAGAKELGLPFVDSASGTYNVFYLP